MKTRILSLALLSAILGTTPAFPFTHSFPRTPSVAAASFQTAGAQTQAPTAPPAGIRVESLYVTSETTGSLFENVAAVLRKKYVDQTFRSSELPKLIAQYADKAKRAITLREQREITQEFLSHIPASHLGLLSKTAYRYVFYDLEGRRYPTVGFQLIEINSRHYAFTVLEAGAGERAGLKPWDRIVTIDGVPVEQSSRVDWRTDDAYIADDRDPPVHYVIAAAGETLRLKVERQPGKFLDLSVPVEDYSAFSAAKASARVLKAEGRSFGYLHFWYVHLTGLPELIKEKLQGEFSACDGLIVDLRGRGGNAFAIFKIIDLLRADQAAKHRPIVALIDRQSRSAKDPGL